MTTISVKDVSAVMNAMSANVSNAQGMAQGASFQNVLNNQTNKNPSSEEMGGQVTGTKNADPKEEALRANETVRKPVKEESIEAVEEVGISEEQNEVAMEVLSAAANEILYQVAETFDMSVEELKQLMDELGMSPVDMLNPEHLGKLLLKVADAGDSIALLTNGELYADFKQLMSKQREVLAMAGEELDVSVERLIGLIREMDETPMQEPERVQIQEVVEDAKMLQETSESVVEPVIELAVEVEETDEPIRLEDDAEVTADSSERVPGAVEKPDVPEGRNRTMTDGGEEYEQGNLNKQTGNPLLQNLKNDVMQPEVSTVQTAPVWDTDTREIMRQIMDYMKVQVKPGASDLEMQLHPESMGTLQIHVSSKGGVLTANFVAQNETVKVALESQMLQLMESFAERGVKVESIEVTVQTHQFERNLDQGRENSNRGEAEKKNRPRRINLNGLSGLDESENLTGEETLAVEMMTANGNTVDYTV